MLAGGRVHGYVFFWGGRGGGAEWVRGEGDTRMDFGFPLSFPWSHDPSEKNIMTGVTQKKGVSTHC